MVLIRELASLGLAARSKVGVRVRQPLEAAEVVLADGARAQRLRPLVHLLEQELNVREVRFTEDPARFVDFQVKPNFRVLGRRLGKDMKACARALSSMSGTLVREQLLAGGVTLELPSGAVTLGEDDVKIEVTPKGTFRAAGSRLALVALNTELDDDLLEEGLCREVVNRVQSLRKSLDLGYTDRIRLGLGGDPALLAAVRRFWSYVAHETLSVELVSAPANASSVQVDGRTLLLWAQRV